MKNKKTIRHNSLKIKSQSQTWEQGISSSGSAQDSNNNTFSMKGNSSASSALHRNTQTS